MNDQGGCPPRTPDRHTDPAPPIGTTLRRWLVRPATTFGGRLLVYLPLAVAGSVGLVSSLWYLVSGHVHGGRPAAAALLAYTAAWAVAWLAAVRAGGRIWHVLVGLALASLLRETDSWITDDLLDGRFPGPALLVAAGLLCNFARFARRERAARRDVVRTHAADLEHAEQGPPDTR